MTPILDWTIAELRLHTSATSRRMTPSSRLSRSHRWSRRSRLRGGRSPSIRIQGPNIGSSRRIAPSMTPRLRNFPGSVPSSSCINGLIKRLGRRCVRWTHCGGSPSGSSSAQLSTCSKTPCSPVPARIGMDASGVNKEITHSPRSPQPSGISPITPSSGSTCISQAHWKDSLPPAPFTLAEIDPAGVLPERPYTRDELHTYLVHLRQKCQTTIAGLSDEKAHQQVSFPWVGEKPMSFLALLLYTMRHVQEHATQLNLFLGQNGISGASDWVSRAKADEGGE